MTVLSATTSRTFAAEQALADKLAAIDWPAHPVTNEVPIFADSFDPSETHREWVVLGIFDADATTVEMAETISEAEEVISLQVIVSGWSPTTTHPTVSPADVTAARARAWELADLVQNIIGPNADGIGNKRLGFDGEVYTSVAGFARSIVPSTDAGCIYRVVISFGCRARFN